MAVAVLSLTPLSAAYALRPLRVAWNLGWCDHDYPRWGGHNPSSRARHTGFSHRVGAPTTPRAGFRPFVANRNIRHFVWYGGVAGEGLRSDGVDDLPLSKSVCSILPIARHLRAGVSRTSHPALRVARDLEWCHHEYPRWGAHTSESTVTTLPVLGTPASIMGR